MHNLSLAVLLVTAVAVCAQEPQEVAAKDLPPLPAKADFNPGGPSRQQRPQQPGFGGLLSGKILAGFNIWIFIDGKNSAISQLKIILRKQVVQLTSSFELYH